MRIGVGCSLVALMLVGPAGLRATAAQDDDEKPERASSKDTAERLGISVERIQRQIARRVSATSRFDARTLRLSTYVEVAARAPRFQLFKVDELEQLKSKAVPYGSPTAREMLDVVKWPGQPILFPRDR